MKTDKIWKYVQHELGEAQALVLDILHENGLGDLDHFPKGIYAAIEQIRRDIEEHGKRAAKPAAGAVCGKKTLGPDDMVRPCPLTPGHFGACDPRHPSERETPARVGSPNDGLHLFAKMKGLGIRAIKVPSGRFVLVGTVPISCSYTRKDGSPISDKQAEGIRHAGPGFVSDLKHVTYATEAEALAAAQAAIKEGR